jgi:hypothetical protein
MLIIAIGITQIHHLPTILVGLRQQARSQSMTHVQLVGAFLMVKAMVSGQRL